MYDMISVMQYGLGPIGSAVARRVVAHPGLELVAAVDIDPEKTGRDAGDVIGLGRQLGFTVRAALREALDSAQPQVALHTTASYFALFQNQVGELLKAGLDVVSTAEELSFPWLAHPQEATELDELAKSHNCRVLGTGINPGYLMDALPISLTALCQTVERLEIRRVIDASTRRGPFQRKIGSGLSVDDFRKRMAAGRMGHVGLPESMDMIFHAFGHIRTHTESSVEPLIADKPIRTDELVVQTGQVRGLKQTATGYTKDMPFVAMTFVADLAAEEEGDSIHITGEPSLEVRLRGTNGDLGTVAMVTNAIPRVLEARPGLLTMLDLPSVRAW